MIKTVSTLIEINKLLCDIVYEQFALLMQYVELEEVEGMFEKMQESTKRANDIKEKIRWNT